jgi:hypothetical protein
MGTLSDDVAVEQNHVPEIMGSGMLATVRDDHLTSGMSSDTIDDAEVTVAIATGYLNSNFSDDLRARFQVVEHESTSILQTHRDVADWFIDHGVFTVIGVESYPEPVQVVHGVFPRQVLETAVVLWNPYDMESEFNSIASALAAARRLTERDGRG